MPLSVRHHHWPGGLLLCVAACMYLLLVVSQSLLVDWCRDPSPSDVVAMLAMAVELQE
jgi:hypothetical protein